MTDFSPVKSGSGSDEDHRNVLKDLGKNVDEGVSQQSSKKWKLEDFKLGKNLGTGKFGSVYLASEKSTKFVFCLKLMSRSAFDTPDLQVMLKREIEIQTHLKHPNIIRMYGYFYDHKRIFEMLEYAPKGSLANDLKLFKFSHERVATHVYQLANALDYCHDLGVIHRDINPSNILMGIDGEVKIADFGCAVHSIGSRRTAVWGTLFYLAPEMTYMDNNHDFKCDVWSLGVTAYEMLCGRVPIKRDSEQETLDAIRNAVIDFSVIESKEAIRFLKKLMTKTVAERVSARDILEDPWIQKNAQKVLNQCAAAKHDWESLAQTQSTVSSAFTTEEETETFATINSMDLTTPANASGYPPESSWLGSVGNEFVPRDQFVASSPLPMETDSGDGVPTDMN